MSELPDNLQKPRETLQVVLRRVHLRVVLMSVALIGLSSMAIEMIVLRMYTLNNLELVASTLGYTVEAAVVFRDREATIHTLADISLNHSVAEAYVVDSNGNTLASWRRFNEASKQRSEQLLASLMLPQAIVGPIMHDGKKIGEVRLVAHGQEILHLLLLSTGGVGLCFLLSSGVAYWLSRKLGQEIVAPIHEITQIAHTARRERQFSRRVTAVNIEEMYQLGDDFNALLSDLELWQTQVKQEKEALTYKTHHDPLTDLYNRSYFENRLQKALSVALETKSMLAVFFIDTDHFKTINDTFGHGVGDEVLRTIGLRLKAHVRGDDVVARLGGDEFAILINPLHDVELANRIAENIIASMKEPISLRDGNSIRASLSIGIALSPNHAEDADQLVKCADEAMYLAKRQQGSAYQIARNDSILT